MKKIPMFFAWLMVIFMSLASCSGGSSGGGDDTGTASESLGAAASAVFGDSGGSESLNAAARIPEKILQLLVRQAIAQSPTSMCDVVEGDLGPTGVTMTLDGEDGTYGASSDSLTVSTSGETKFCSDGGDVVAWEISEAIDTTCTQGEASFTVNISGSGVIQFGNADGTLSNVYGTITTTIADDSASGVDCSFVIDRDAGTFSGSCDGVSSLSTDITCSAVDEGEEETGGDSGCTEDQECIDFLSSTDAPADFANSSTCDIESGNCEVSCAGVAACESNMEGAGATCDESSICSFPLESGEE